MDRAVDLLTGPPLRALDPDWAARLASAPRAQRDEWLLVADRLRSRDVDGHHRAQSCYLALRADLDPVRARDAERLEWLLTHGAPRDAALAAAAGRAQASPDIDLRDAGLLARAECAAVVGDEPGAESAIRGLLARRGRDGSALAAWGWSSLSLVLLRQGREQEAYLAATQAARNVERRLAASPRERCVARQRIAQSLSALDETRELVDRAVEQVEDAAAATPDALAWPFRAWVFAARADLALKRGEAEEATQALARLESSVPEGLPLSSAPGFVEERAAAVALAHGRPEEALERVTAAARARGLPPEEDGALARLVLRAHVSLGDLDEARRVARARLDAIENAAHRGAPGAGLRARHALELAETLVAELGDGEESQRAAAVAAREAARRIVELDACVREVREIAEADPKDLDRLAVHRERYATRLGVLGTALARAVVSGPERSEEIAALFPEGAWISLCSGCASAKTAEGRWIPVGHWIPRKQNLHVTHGICDRCAMQATKA